MAKSDSLERYKAKRDFSLTSEPSDGGAANDAAPSFVVQKHWASRLHYDFRLELEGTMKSWAVPKGPSFDPSDKRMAVHVEDHPISYNTFEGTIPPKQYGAGKVIIWDRGIWEPLDDAARGYRDGKLKFALHGQKLHGRWTLVRMHGKSGKQEPWLLIKEKDEFARDASEFSVVDERPESVAALDDVSRKAALPRKKAAGAGNKAPMPATFRPQLATLADGPPGNAQDWLYEIKFDGYRILARIEKNSIQLFTRNGHDWTSKLSRLAKDLAAMKLPDGWYDGEIAVNNDKGLPDFQLLQGAFDSNKTETIVYYLFDLPFCNGYDLRELPLVERREKLRALLAEDDSKGSGQRKVQNPETIRFSDTFDVAARDIIASACKLGLEGVIGKRKDSPYVCRRSADWIKLKCSLRQEFVIGGYTKPQGSRSGIGSLLLGVHDDTGALRYAGNVGTGFNAKTLTDIRKKLDTLQSEINPFSTSTGIDRKAQWVEPVLLAEVSFGQWTNTGRIRHSVFHGLRTDKPAEAITREDSMSTTPSKLGNLKITSPERVIDDSTGITKIDLIRYYALVAPLMMEHLKGRPVSLVRAPDGVKGEIFFQKHLETNKMTGIRLLPKELDPDHEPLMEVATEQGLASAAQMNVIEFHTWNAVKTRIDKPDRMTFDLDPGTGVEWPAMQEAALVLRAFLNELGLSSFVKTSGGKGLHVVVPVKRRHDWDTVKDFSHAIVEHLAQTLPKRYVAKSGPRNRVGKIFIDYLRNGFGATTAAAWSARARPGMGVSVPISWDEVEKIKSSAHWHVRNIHERLDAGNTPWNEYQASAKTLTAAMKTLGFK
ncbi:DNA ligase D [Pollutimonas nitritireducens]|uniref:DNA ligase (ATP) n=1 Tax=Pollutimonas nitritireducens TaxID=2045209 RepID=A0A2N4UFX6_9BURK|nr:DNA ligase D [Pollutimonas nitritireducens]PLC53895.1 DNA ligase D [Pollutimonas nitritireducens]